MYYFTLFKANWCGHCQNFLTSGFKDVQRYVNDNKDFYDIIVYDDEKDRQVMSKYNVNGYPTIRLYEGKNKQLTKELGEFDNRDPGHIIRVLESFKQKRGGGKSKIEKFTPTPAPIQYAYQSIYQNNNGKESGQVKVCENGVCKVYKPKTKQEFKQIRQYNVKPFDIFDSYKELNDFNDVFNDYNATLNMSSSLI